LALPRACLDVSAPETLHAGRWTSDRVAFLHHRPPVGGSFSDQFKDQLRLATHLDLRQILDASRNCLTGPKPHVRRYAEWVRWFGAIHDQPEAPHRARATR